MNTDNKDLTTFYIPSVTGTVNLKSVQDIDTAFLKQSKFLFIKE